MNMVLCCAHRHGMLGVVVSSQLHSYPSNRYRVVAKALELCDRITDTMYYEYGLCENVQLTKLINLKRINYKFKILPFRVCADQEKTS